MSTNASGLDVKNLTVRGLLSSYSAILRELRRRGIVRSSNNPLSDYAEVLFCKAFGWSRENNSAAGYDAKAGEVRYQIKGRRLTAQNPSRQVGAIRNLEKDPFDHLAGVLVGEDFEIIRAALVPIAVIRAESVHVVHTNSWRFILRDEIWSLPDVRDVTEELRAAAVTI